MKILLVSWSILPRSGGSSVIVEQLAQNFKRPEMVVLGGRPISSFQTPTRNSNGPKFLYFKSEIGIGGRGARFFSGLRNARFNALVKQIGQVIEQHNIDRVVGIYPDAMYCLAACRAAAAASVPFSSYFHNTYVENSAISDPKAAEIQAEIFASSKHIFVMSKGMQAFYQQQYPTENIVPLVHTFKDWPQQSTLSGLPEVGKDHYKLVAVGNFNESNIEATKRLVEAIADNPKYSLSLYTHVPPMLLKMRGIDPSLIEHKGEVRPDQVHDELQQYDICVLTHGFTGGYGTIEYKTIFPTRTIPLLLSGKPILAHSPNGSFLNSFIEENSCAELVDKADKAAIIAGLDRIAGDAAYQQQLVGAAKATAAQFYGPNVAAELKKLLA